MTHKTVRIASPDGLKSRPAAAFVAAASRFSSQILVEVGNKKINAKSIMGVLSLGAIAGDKVHIYAKGEDEKEAVVALCGLIEG